MNCPRWPLNSLYKVINKDCAFDGSSTQLVFMGPDTQTNTQLAWLMLACTFSYDTPTLAGLTVTPFYQANETTQQRDIHTRCVLGQGLGTHYNIFPIIGCASVQQTLDQPPIVGRASPLYLPAPDELILAITNGVPGRKYQFRAVVLEVPTDVNISEFL